MSNKSFCDICGKEVRETPAYFFLRKHGIVVEAKVTNWGTKVVPRVDRGIGFAMDRELNHICHRCLLDIVRTGTPDPNGWSREEMIELGIGNVQGIRSVKR
jgi:hypothetical protein